MSSIERNSNGEFLLKGELSFATVPELNRNGQKLIASNSEVVKFDLREVTYNDNAAVALLTSWARYAKKNGKRVLFINLPKQLFDLIKASGIENLLPIS